MNETILFVLIIVVIIAIVVSIALRNDKEINENKLIVNNEELTEEQKLIYLSIIEAKNNIRTIKNILVIILLILFIPLVIRTIAFFTTGVAFSELFNNIY